MGNADLIPAAGDVLAGKYRIERVIGRGGMGIVLSATHLQLEELVAIKFLLPELAHDPALVSRFLREGRAAIKIRSEHVVRVLDVASMPGGTPYLVMEHLQGKNFEELLEDQGRLPAELAVDHILQATEALAEAHARGLIHRDLKPANLFLAHRADGSPCVKVLDFGITKLVEAAASHAGDVAASHVDAGVDSAPPSSAGRIGVGNPASLDETNANLVMGSPRYMSPEQLRSTRAIDARADIWSLGIILYELVTGVSPFDGETMTALLAAILQQPTPSIRGRQPDAPAGLDAVVARCLEKDPTARYADVAELTQALAPFGSVSARVSADRVSRVIRPRSPNDSRTSAPVVRATIPSIAEMRQEPPNSGNVSGNVTVSATAGWDALAPSPRGKSRSIALAVGAVAFASTMFFAIFGAHRPQRASVPEVAARPSEPVAAARPSEPAFTPNDLVPTPAVLAAEVTATAPPASAPVAPASAAGRSKREPHLSAPARAKTAAPPTASAPAPVASAAPAPQEQDLFDGRK